MKVLVTGAAGFIGSHLAERLAELGHDVHGVDCLNDYYSLDLKRLNAEQVEAAGVTIHSEDLAADDLAKLCEGIEVVFHLAGQPGLSSKVSFEDYKRNNIDATFRLLEACVSAGSVKSFINIATSSVYGADATGPESNVPQPTSYYGVTKLAAEQLALSYQRSGRLPTCSCRLFSVYGPRERPEKLYPILIRAILEDGELPLYEGSEDHLRSFTYVSDIVDGLVSCMPQYQKCDGEVFNIGCDTAITTGEGIEIVEKLVGKKVKVARKPKRAGDQLRTHANIDKARKVLGYNPQVQPEEGFAKTIEWFKSHIIGKASP